ncbi:cystathionine gamma-lyase [Streptomyces sp. AJS327]|uniref:cystathionine gamma-lyase n=1 Tax=Streptomyces sp. AJS327 TaxID=2545265 RepID=UPI0015DF0DF7|nr:cystathionine gamma-lyase [Streptomyces sp. AJS327]MBA0052889.1 cystathionine gamma-lyase [Streptomyces sp. AJS327]
MTDADGGERPPRSDRPQPAQGAEGAVPGGSRDGTRVTRAGLPESLAYTPSLPGPAFAAHYHLPGAVEGAPYSYGRDANPTWTALERAILELEVPGSTEAPATGTPTGSPTGELPGESGPDGEQPECVVFASGMAALSAVLFSQLRQGDTAVLPSDGYQLLPALRERLEGFGVTVHTAPTAEEAQLPLLDGARLLWIESPSNPVLDVCDIRRLTEAARRAGALVAVDNTLATPLGQRPLALGADFAVASGTKALTGHGDVLLGYVVCRNRELADSVRQWRKTIGAIPGPMEAWLAHRSLATLDVRTARQAANALAVAEALELRPEVSDVRHPGLPGDPGHARAVRQMRRFGCVVSFTLPDLEFAERFLAALRFVDSATSFGGVRSTAERRGRWGGDAVPEGFVRLSVGVEDPADLVADLRQALDAAATHPPHPAPPSGANLPPHHGSHHPLPPPT